MNGRLPFIVGKDGEDMAGRPKKFKEGKHLVELFAEFCDSIKTDMFLEVPTQTNFCRWLSQRFSPCDRKTIYNSLNEYFPTIKKQFEQLQSDTIAEGAMLGHYQPTMSIFALKNWCRWQDKPEPAPADPPDDSFLEALEGKAAKLWEDDDV